MSETRKPIVIVGSITMDLVTRTPKIPAIGQTLIGTGFHTTPGGKGANQAVAAARLGAQVAMMAKVGDDAYGPALLENLKRAGVETAGMTQVSGSSGLAPMFVADDGLNAIVVVPGANGMMDRATVDAHAELIRGAGMVLCQLEIPMETLSYTLEFCAKANVPVMLDPAPAADLPERVWEQVAWFTPNETETDLYVWGSPSLEDSAKMLLKKSGLRGVVLKRGGDGAYVAVQGGRAEWVKAFKVNAIDTVAAGDCFNGAFAVALLEGRDPWAAARFANAAAAICVTRKGAQQSMPMRDEVEEFLRRNG